MDLSPFKCIHSVFLFEPGIRCTVDASGSLRMVYAVSGIEAQQGTNDVFPGDILGITAGDVLVRLQYLTQQLENTTPLSSDMIPIPQNVMQARGMYLVAENYLRHNDPEFEKEGNAQLKKYGYAPGNYSIMCHDCHRERIDCDKRAIRCRDCAEIAASKDIDKSQERRDD